MFGKFIATIKMLLACTAILVVTGFWLLVFWFRNRKKEEAMTRWEYWEHRVSFPEIVPTSEDKAMLARMGCQGWELCSVVVYGSSMVYFFKRPLPALEIGRH